MMNAVNNITAALAANSGKPEGGIVKATVMRGPSSDGVFTLRLSGGREIDVQAEDGESSAMLSPGQKVLVNPSDGKIFIPVEEVADRPTQSQQWAQAQQPAQERQSAQMLLRQVRGGDEFVSGKQPAEAAANGGGGGGVDGAEGEPQTSQAGLAKIVGFKVISDGEAHADGIYRADAAGHIIEEPADGEAPIKDFAAVRLNTVNGQQVVTVISGDGLSAALEELRGNFESPLLKALPLELLKDIFNERGFIDTDTLKALDAALVNRNLSIDTSSQFQMERIGQWLRIALDNPGMAQELVDRIPALGAKETAGLLELIGRLSPGAAPESFFATGNTLSSIGTNIGTSVNSAELLQSLVKAAFSSAPDALLNLVKRIDNSNVVLGAQLPQTEAARIVREITNAMPAQAAAKPGSLHDAGQLSLRVLTADIPQPQTTQTPAAAAPQIRAGYSDLTETAVRVLLGGGGKADAAVVGEKINALRAAVERMPVMPSGQNRVDGVNTNSTNSIRVNTNGIDNNGTDGVRINTTGINNNGANGNRINVDGINNNIGGNTTATRYDATGGNRAEKISLSINPQPAVSRLSIPTGEANVNVAKAPDAFPHINAQLAVHRSSAQRFGDVNNTNVGGSNINTKVTDALSAVSRGFVSQRQQTVATQTNRVVAVTGASVIDVNGVNKSAVNTNGINTANIGVDRIDNKVIDANVVSVNRTGANSINDNSVNRNNTGVNNINADRADANNINNNGINANNINSTNNQSMRSETGIAINRPISVDGPRDLNSQVSVGVGTNSVHSAYNQNARIDIADSINRFASVNKSTSIGVNSAYATPPDVPAIKENCLSIVDSLKSSAAPILRELAQRGQVSAGGSATLIGIVRDAVASLDEALRPLVRSERPVPPEFYARVATNAGHKISAEAKNALFSQIGSAQELIRRAVETVERVNNRSINPSVNPTVNANISVPRINNPVVNPNVNTGININPVINADVNSGIKTNVNPHTNTGINADTTVNHNNNTSINTVVNPVVDFGINTNVRSGINANTAVGPDINTDINPIANPNVGTDINSKVSSNVNLNINTNADIAAPNNTNASINSNANVNTAPPPDNRPDDFLRIARRIWANTEKLRAGFKEAFSTLDLQNRAAPLDQPVDDTTAGTVRHSADSLRTEMLLDVSKALRDVFSSVDELREIVSQLSAEQKALPEVEAALLRAVRALEHQARQSGTDVMERLKEVLRELNRLQADAARAQEQGMAGAALRSSPTEAIRSAALTAARSLENLQLLSTQTRTAETEQHLLAIPAKIGGEWTEVQIKFVKERKGEKGENKDGRVSIYLNVAPSALGQVTAHLDYHPPNLKLAFQFEKPEVTRWFRQRSGELREALSQVGLPGTVLEFYNKRPINKDPAAPLPSPSDIDGGDVDQADDFEVKNGRVDFKI